MTEMQEAARKRHEEGMRRASEARALRTPEQVAEAEFAEAKLLSRFFRMFAGTEEMSKSKGHQPCVVVSVAEMREFRKSEPATHRWAAFEQKFLDMGDL